MGHGNSNKLYITHAEHAGDLGQHSASSSGYKACVVCRSHFISETLLPQETAGSPCQSTDAV
ncbi:hypothetical protein JVU11DRAFT_5059 [Chiua virens]|nr:hypothetical protein JVU11DRAFT_5059 [Chiua virens]